jgi:hypothetical protein
MRLLNSPATEALAGRRVVLRDSGLIWDPDPADRVGKRFEFEADQLVVDYRHNSTNFLASLNELYKFVRRNVVAEAYEVVKTYSTAANIVPIWQAAPWYHFARVTRNAMAHNFVITFDKHSLAALPITCFGKTIDASAAVTEITTNVLDPYVTIELLSAIRKFVETH